MCVFDLKTFAIAGRKACKSVGIQKIWNYAIETRVIECYCNFETNMQIYILKRTKLCVPLDCYVVVTCYVISQ